MKYEIHGIVVCHLSILKISSSLILELQLWIIPVSIFSFLYYLVVIDTFIQSRIIKSKEQVIDSSEVVQWARVRI